MNLVKNTLTCHISQSVITVIHSQETTDLTELTAISFLTQVSLLQTHVHWALMLQDRLSSMLTNGHSSFLIQQPVQFSTSAISDSLRSHGLQHARPPCPSPTPGVYPNSWPLSRWCHPTTSSSVIPFSSHLQSFPASGSFQMSQFFTSVGKVLEFQFQHQSFQGTFRTDLP